MRTRHPHAAALVAGSLALLPPALPAHAAPRAPRAAASSLVGKSYCFTDAAGTQRFSFTGQAGDKLLGSITAYRAGSNEQAWRFALLTAPRANGAVATLDGDQLSVVFQSPQGEPSGHDELTVDPAADTFTGTGTTYQGSGHIDFARC